MEVFLAPAFFVAFLRAEALPADAGVDAVAFLRDDALRVVAVLVAVDAKPADALRDDVLRDVALLVAVDDAVFFLGDDALLVDVEAVALLVALLVDALLVDVEPDAFLRVVVFLGTDRGAAFFVLVFLVLGLFWGMGLILCGWSRSPHGRPECGVIRLVVGEPGEAMGGASGVESELRPMREGHAIDEPPSL
ncbi:MAG: hypothetical protein KDK70_44150, partial [Myxococcales bacterium]|nr:hypothetical protein [Myxococcales bacterium]